MTTRCLRIGIESANMTAPVSVQGVQTFKNLYDSVAEGKTPEKFVSLPILPIGQDNLDDYIAWDDYEKAYSLFTQEKRTQNKQEEQKERGREL